MSDASIEVVRGRVTQEFPGSVVHGLNRREMSKVLLPEPL